MSSQKLLNSPNCCVQESLEGLVAVNPGLRILNNLPIILRSDIGELKKNGQVALLSGGGSGHEPAHAGFVGKGMLSGAIAGAIFTSPPVFVILSAIKAVGLNNSGGVLLIVKNYTGDRLNFGIALEKARLLGIKIKMIVIGEDCALTSSDKTAGRRGLAGTVFIHKIAGALADKGQSLDSIYETVSLASNEMGTIGLCVKPCILPGSKSACFKLDENEMELGLGIHGEAGVKRISGCSAKEAVSIMLNHMFDEDNFSKLVLKKGDQIALMVNNLGGLSILELNVVSKEALNWLKEFGVHVVRAFVGSFMTSLEMSGVSFTVMILNDERKFYLDAVTSAPAWIKPYLFDDIMKCRMHDHDYHGNENTTHMEFIDAVEVADSEELMDAAVLTDESASIVHKVLLKVCRTLIDNTNYLNDLDKRSGDGDCGTTISAMASYILESLEETIERCVLPIKTPYATAMYLAGISEKHMGGTSGALYELFFSAAASPLKHDSSVKGYANALQAGVDAIQKYGRAEEGDRTMLDSLHPALKVISQKLDKRKRSEIHEVLEDMAVAAEIGASSTTKMKARAGRASYVNENYLTLPDPGAVAVSLWFRAIADEFKTLNS